MASYAFINDSTVDDAVRPSGLVRENKRDRKSARSSVISKSALYSRCSCRLPRRTSKMTASAGLSAMMYGKFCSGPTPRYTRPAFAVSISSGMTT